MIMVNFESQLKHALEETSVTRYKLSKLTGLAQSQLSYFLSGKRSLSLDAASKLASALGFELIQTGKVE